MNADTGSYNLRRFYKLRHGPSWRWPVWGLRARIPGAVWPTDALVGLRVRGRGEEEVPVTVKLASLSHPRVSGSPSRGVRPTPGPGGGCRGRIGRDIDSWLRGFMSFSVTRFQNFFAPNFPQVDPMTYLRVP